MKSAPRLLAAFLILSSVPAVQAQTSAEPPPTPSPAATPDTPRTGDSMQAAMQKMQQQMAEIRSTTDPAKQKKLMHEHMFTMRDAMIKLMNESDIWMMQRGGMMQGSRMAQDDSKSSANPEQRLMREMEQRMRMMEMMMDQMMQHQGILEDQGH